MKIFEIEVAHGERVKDTSVKNGTLDRTKFNSDNFRVIKDAESKDGLYFCAAKIEGSRKNENATEVPLLVFDIDDSPRSDVQITISMLKQKGLEFLIYTTASYNPEEIDPITNQCKYKCRLVMPLETPIKGSQYSEVMRYVASEYKIKFDPAANKVSQPFFYPTVKESNKQHAKCVGQEGSAFVIDKDLLETLKEDYSKKSSGPIAHRMPQPPFVFKEANVLAAVYNTLNVSAQSYEEWRDVCFAMHHQTQGAGFDSFNDWSAMDTRAGKYSKDEVQDRWDKIDDEPSSGGVYTLRTLLNRKLGANVRLGAKVYGNLIEQCDENDKLTKFSKYVMEDFQPSHEEVNGFLATSFKKAKKIIHGIDITPVQAAHELRTGQIGDSERTYFSDRFVYMVNDRYPYIDITDDQHYNKDSFHQAFSRKHTERNKEGVYMDVCKLLASTDKYEAIRICKGTKYRPLKSKLLDEPDGLYLNSFQADSWPMPVEPFDPLGNAIDAEIDNILMAAFKVLANGEKGMSTHLRQFLGHLRQRPDVKIKHAFAITSIAGGIGKSTLTELYEAVLGAQNVASLTLDALEASFDAYRGWPVLMTFCDEMDDKTGKYNSKAESFVKKLKEPISADKGAITSKGVDTKSGVEYYAAYAIFSNDPRILGTQSNDRRWAHSNVTMIRRKLPATVADSSLCNALGENQEVFFDRYKSLLSSYGDRFAAYFDSLSLDGFSATKAHKSESSIVDDSSYSFHISAILKEKISNEDDDEMLNEDIVQLTHFVNLAVKSYKEMFPDANHSPSKFREEAKQILLDSGYIPMRRGKMVNMGHANAVAAGFYYFKPQSMEEVDIQEREFRKKYNQLSDDDV